MSYTLDETVDDDRLLAVVENPELEAVVSEVGERLGRVVDAVAGV